MIAMYCISLQKLVEVRKSGVKESKMSMATFTGLSGHEFKKAYMDNNNTYDLVGIQKLYRIGRNLGDGRLVRKERAFRVFGGITSVVPTKGAENFCSNIVEYTTCRSDHVLFTDFH